jgi:signal transduction histidine kinase
MPIVNGFAGPNQLRRLLDAIVGLAELDLNVVLHRITEVAAELVDAKYAALGVLSTDRSHLSDFITVGVTPEEVEAIGDLPKGHGILGLLIVEPQPLRLPDLSEHPDSYGFPPNHPRMQSFLGVPIFVRGAVYGNLYLTEKRDGGGFTDIDEELVVGLASAAGVAIENARLHARVREVDLLEDRERIARDLHDTVIQRLFTIGLSLQGASRIAERPEVVDRIERAVAEIDATVREVRSSIFELLPTALASGGLRSQVRAVADELAEALGFGAGLRFEGAIDNAVDDELAVHVLAVVREGLANVARHANATTATVAIEVDDTALVVRVVDNGRGPGGGREGGRGLHNLSERAAQAGGEFKLVAQPEGGTAAIWRAPLQH